ncbi:MAG: response regulator transcription factor [Actinomycetota bacterium]|nr:response regulator transcription factor [Actinomycetota bacterium]
MEAALHPSQAMTVRVLIADDEPLFVEMVEALLAGDDRIEVVGTAGNGKEAVDLSLSLAPDVTLMDISMPGVDGIEASRQIRAHHPHACILILTGSSISADVDRSRQAGAAGFLTKDRIATHLVERILDLGAR